MHADTLVYAGSRHGHPVGCRTEDRTGRPASGATFLQRLRIRVTRPLRPLVLGLATAWAIPDATAAQIRPGIERGDYWGAVRARYRSEVLAEIGPVLQEWETGWNNDDPVRMASFYAEETFVLLEETVERSRTDVRRELEEMLPRVGTIQLGLQDFTVAGDLAVATLAFRYSSGESSLRNESVSGFMMVVFSHASGEWRIRSQVLRPGGGAGDGAGPPGAGR